MDSHRDTDTNRPRRSKREVKLEPPPRVGKVKPIVLESKRDGREVKVRNGGLGWGTVAVFAVLLLMAFSVFFFLPQWVSDRPVPAASPLSAPALETPHEETSPTEEAEPTPAPATASQPDRVTAEVHAAAREPENKSENKPEKKKDAREVVSHERRPKPEPVAHGTSRETNTEQAFTRAMSDGIAALARRDYRSAREAFQRANGIRPGAPQPADGLAQADEGLNLQAIAEHREKALAFEKLEGWRKAAAQYQAVMGLDPTIRFAQEGKARALERAELSERLEFHLKNPSRLSDDNVLAEASALLAAASGIDPAGPELSRQRRGLGSLVAIASSRVQVVFESDNLTDVMVYKTGRLGKFTRRELDLRPGSYTVVGSRRGYKDVQRQLVVEAGAAPKPFEVRCEEKI